MGNPKGYVPSEESKIKASESLKRAYAEGRRKPRSYYRSPEVIARQAESLRRAYAEGRAKITGAALEKFVGPKLTAEEKKSRKADRQRKWRDANPEKMREYKARYHPQDYGLTADQYNVELLAREGKCDICQNPQSNGIRLAIDHDHSCCPERSACEKCRRGLLCSNCNQLLGKAKDRVEILKAAIAYLEKFRK